MLPHPPKNNPKSKDFTTGLSRLDIPRIPTAVLNKLRVIAKQAGYKDFRTYIIDLLKRESER